MIKFYGVIISLTLLSLHCNRAGTESYLTWYSKIESKTLKQGTTSVSLKEYPFEIGWISFYKNQLTPKLIDSLKKNAPPIVQVKLKIIDSSKVQTPSIPGQLTEIPYVFIDKKRALDCYRISGNTNNIYESEYMIVFDKKRITQNSTISILLQSSEQEFTVPISEVIIQNPKSLKI